MVRDLKEDSRSYKDERLANCGCMNYALFVGLHAYTLISEVRAVRYCEAALADRLKCTAQRTEKTLEAAAR